MTGPHPLAAILRRAALGSPPAPDATVEILPGPPGLVDAVCAFTAHTVVAAALPALEIRSRLDAHDLAAPMSATFLAWLAERLGTRPGAVDIVMAAPRPTTTGLALEARGDLAGHPRVRRATRYRRDVRVFAPTDGSAVVTIGRGLADRWEMAFEVEPAHRGRGLGRMVAAAASRLVPDDEALFAQCSPGNVASLRALLAAGYRPIAAECLFLRRGD